MRAFSLLNKDGTSYHQDGLRAMAIFFMILLVFKQVPRFWRVERIAPITVSFVRRPCFYNASEFPLRFPLSGTVLEASHFDSCSLASVRSPLSAISGLLFISVKFTIGFAWSCNQLAFQQTCFRFHFPLKCQNIASDEWAMLIGCLQSHWPMRNADG